MRKHLYTWYKQVPQQSSDAVLVLWQHFYTHTSSTTRSFLSLVNSSPPSILHICTILSLFNSIAAFVPQMLSSTFFFLWKPATALSVFLFVNMLMTMQSLSLSSHLISLTSVYHLLHHHFHRPLLLLSSIPDSKLVFSANPFYPSSPTFLSTGLQTLDSVVFRFYRACRFLV